MNKYYDIAAAQSDLISEGISNKTADTITGMAGGATVGGVTGAIGGAAVGAIRNHFSDEAKESRKRMKAAKTALKSIRQAKKLKETKNNPEARLAVDATEDKIRRAIGEEKFEYGQRRGSRMLKYSKAGMGIGASVGAIAGGRKGAKEGEEEEYDKREKRYVPTPNFRNRAISAHIMGIRPNSSQPFNQPGKKFRVIRTEYY